MSAKSESYISTIWGIFKAEICPEALGEKLTSKSRWGKGWNEGEFFFLFLWGEQKGRGGGTDSIFSEGKSMLAAMNRCNQIEVLFQRVFRLKSLTKYYIQA